MRTRIVIGGLRVAPVIALAALLLAPGGAAGRDQGDALWERVYFDVPDEEGRLSGGYTMMPIPEPLAAVGGFGAPFTTIMDNGPPSNRIDLVFVGDGYLEPELGTYAVHVNDGMVGLFGLEPFSTYVNLFNAHRVDVISNESGVDNDPDPGIDRDTAMDMGFWCNGIERLLCVDVSLAYQYADNAPDVDQLLAVANSTKYGGAGYSASNVATYSGGNSAAVEVAIHEIGHSLGDLADEYDYDDGATYTGPERPQRNVSILNAAAMAVAGTKWADWLGDPGIGFGGLHSTYEGAAYYQYGIYRPTFDSQMRSLGAPFNLPSAEGLIIEIYKIVDPIDDATPTGQTLAGTDTVFVDPVDPVGHALDIQWSLDGTAIPGATEATLDLGTLGLDVGTYELSVTVTDPTSLVSDESARSAWMTQTLTWDVVVMLDLDIKPGSCPNSFNRNSNGVLPVALTTTEGLDVTQVDLGTILLSRSDGVGGGVAPNEGPPGPHSVFEDVTTPFAGETCECDELPADGIMDLSMKFWSNDVVEALELDDLPAGEFVELELSGTLLDGTEFAVRDCIRLVPPGDMDGDGAVGVTDLLGMLAGWGPCPAPPADCLADINDDGTVGAIDLLALLANWGSCF